MSIPLDRSEKSECKPASLANLPAAPIFYFRPATPRDTRTFRNLCEIEGLRLHTQDDFRAAIRAELKAEWDEAYFGEAMPRIQAIWDAMDHNARLPADAVEIDKDELDKLQVLMQQLEDNSRKLRRMKVDNANFMEDAPKLAVGLFLTGWANFGVVLRKEAGVIPLETVDEIEATLTELEKQAKADGHPIELPGLAFAEVALHAFNLMALTEKEAGNSEPPSVSGKTPNSLSPESSPQTAAGGSQASGKPKKTRRRG